MTADRAEASTAPAPRPARDLASRPRALVSRLREAPPLLLGAALLALLPAARMTWWVLSGTPVQFGDYWIVLDGLIRPSGRLDLADLADLYNGHVMVVPKLAYWLNIEVFGGSNTTLGLGVVALALVQVALLWWVAPRGRRVHPLVTAAVVVATGALLFAPQGAWSFLRSMSGVAWLAANAAAVAAVVVRARGRDLPALVLAVVAVLSYGTGVVVVPALLVTDLVRDRRPGARQVPVVVLGAAVAAWYVVARGDGPPRPGPLTTAENALTVLGGLVGVGSSAATWVGAALVVAAAGLTATAVVRRSEQAAPWIGVLAYALGSAVLIGYGREGFTDFTDSRYASLAALAWLATTALLALVVGRAPAAIPILAVAVLVTVTGLAPVRDAREAHRSQQELAHAQRLGIADGGTAWIGFQVPMPALDDRLERLGHHPFGSSEPGCGLLGERVEEAEVPAIGTDGTQGAFSGVVDGPDAVPRAAVLTGWADRPGSDVECVVVVDGDGRVVGLGTHGWDRLRLQGEPATDGIRALAPRGTEGAWLLVRFSGDDTGYRLAPPGG